MGYERDKNELPHNWHLVKIGEIADLVCRGITPRYGKTSDEIVLGQTCIRNNLVIVENGRPHAPKKITEKWLKKNDLLINSTGVGSLGRTAQVWFNPDKLVVDSHITIVRAKNPSHALYLGFWAFGHEKYIESLHTGSTGQTELPRDRVKAIELVLPSEQELEEFNSFAKPSVELIVANQEENRRLTELRDGLLPRLMSGEIDVSKVDFTQLNSHLPVLCGISWNPSTNEGSAMDSIVNVVLGQMKATLDAFQIKRLKEVLIAALQQPQPGQTDIDLLALFLTAKTVEGCSPKTIEYYRNTLAMMQGAIGKPVSQIESDDLRCYLDEYEQKRHASKVTIDIIRRIMSSFFSWLEDEDYIVKSPVRRIKRVKTAIVAKETFTDEQLELIRISCRTARDLAIVDLLASTGMRVGELVGLNRADIDFRERECIVTGKGNKQRPVYFDARTKQSLISYLRTRSDQNPAVFASLVGEPKRVTIGAVETRLREIGEIVNAGRVHPHKFRRTLATHAIDKGMPVEQVQKLLGHAKIDTTMRYAMVNQNNVKTSHRKYLE